MAAWPACGRCSARAGFLCRLLPLCGPRPFAGWRLVLGQQLAALAADRPLVSGTYRLAATALQLSDGAGTFEAVAAREDEGDGGVPTAAERATRWAVTELFRDLLRHVLVSCRQYKVRRERAACGKVRRGLEAID